jgi:uncharacterized protein YjgD (DUF1641 family)
MDVMSEVNVQTQINEINQKLDLLLDYVNQQRLKADVVEDLVADLAIVGKDVYDSTVTELENQSVEIDPDSVKIFLIRLLKNVENFSQLLEFFESMNDLLRDVRPIANEVLIDITKKMNEFEKKGYFDFIKASAEIIDNVVSHYTVEDVKMLADNVVVIMETVKGITQPDMLSAINNATAVFKNMEMDNVPEISLMKAMREMRSPEMKKGLGFIITFLKNLNK